MRNSALVTILASAAVASAQVTVNNNGTYTCSKPNAAFCAGDSMGTDIIIRCDATGNGQPGRCSDVRSPPSPPPSPPPMATMLTDTYRTSPASPPSATRRPCATSPTRPPATLPARRTASSTLTPAPPPSPPACARPRTPPPLPALPARARSRRRPPAQSPRAAAAAPT